MANYGFHPKALLGLAQVLRGSASNIVSYIMELHRKIASNLSLAIALYKSKADAHQKPHFYLSPGDLVMVFSKISTITQMPQNRTLLPGSFKVKQMINEAAYEIQLSPKSCVHPVFHISLLRHFEGIAPFYPEAIISAIQVEQEFEVESILKSQVCQGCWQYLVKWARYPIKYSTWQLASDCAHCPQLIREFHKQT